ncbi:hypothetical protein IOK49_01065 [Fervidicoccus fontis]|jgi:hypothetical protein|uniref:lipoate--protein ligase n=1 Tax=Fervidicoccus fontis TaxID=683846 RepID=A0A7C2VES7_9CREN|nr:lipoate protein ligase C-terminal domain-containing protein [Fervidicoccus fontis]MBE9390677.1 hypothetical protein [Fervidicoccus fontis]PMB77602.1 MAG: hypothetical protein C0177_02830 [Fervidicoccus fontis]HEW63847.1 hypothetical protein [Fervidicoccus fontis]
MRETYSEYKAKKGLLKSRVLLSDDDKIEKIEITGDFFIYPEEFLWILEERLKGTKFDENAVKEVVTKLIDELGAEFVGMTPDDLVRAIIGGE